MTLTCKEVNIRFINQNLHQQRIRYTELTAASHLEIKINPEFITIMYMYIDASGKSKPLKILIFNKQQVVEVECADGVQSEPTVC